MLQSATSSADIGLIPYSPVDINTTYCTPNKLFEYLASGLPIGYHHELLTVKTIIEHEQIGISFDINDSKGVSCNVMDLLHDKKRLQQIKNNISKIHYAYSWQRQSKQFIKAVKSIA